MRLNDKNIVPTDELIFSVIGDKKLLWERIMQYVSGSLSDATGTWNYYNDGKQWLFRLMHKKKTIFWAGLVDDTMRVTFWLGEKAEPVIEASLLPPSLKDEFRNAKKYGLIRPVSILLNEHADADNVITLVSIKQKIK
jgi:Protein of unknown function (DUF3788)